MKRPTSKEMAMMKEELYLLLAQGDIGIREATRRIKGDVGSKVI